MDVLEQILSLRKERLADTKAKFPLSDLKKRAGSAPAPKNFLSALKQGKKVSLIAEMKMKSPSAGLLRSHYDIAEIAKSYEGGGASALSVLTEFDRFGGKIEDIQKARSASSLPILRKDFIFDEYQIIEARAFGADAVLLIVDMVEPAQLKDLVKCAQQLGLTALVEIFSGESLDSALQSGSPLVGINTRNLRTLQMFPHNVEELSKMIPKDRTIVAESGIRTTADVSHLKQLGMSAMLVGESLLKQENLEKATRVLVEAGS